MNDIDMGFESGGPDEGFLANRADMQGFVLVLVLVVSQMLFQFERFLANFT